jgi:hypothetical protein
MKLKRKWLFISALAVIALLVAGIIGGAVLANASTPVATDNQTTFAARVAKILGIDQATVESAMTQAREEMRDEAMDARLQKMVGNGKITQEQADQYKEWIKSRPDLPVGKGFPGMMGGRGGDRGGCFPGMGGRDFNRNFAPNPNGTN